MLKQNKKYILRMEYFTFSKTSHEEICYVYLATEVKHDIMAKAIITPLKLHRVIYSCSRLSMIIAFK